MTNQVTTTEPLNRPVEADALARILQAATDPSVDVDKMERLMAIYEKMVAKKAEAEFNEALSAMQQYIPTITKTGRIEVRGTLQSKYAKYEDINEAVKPIMQQYGFAVSFRVDQADGLKVKSVLSHRGGHSIETTIALPVDSTGNKNNVQGVGSSITYGRRYGLCALLNITTEDEDKDGHGDTPVKYITASQVDIVTGLLDNMEREKKFCLTYSIESIRDLPAEQFDRAVAQIKAANAKIEGK